MPRLLVMDDEPQVVLALTRALEGLGHQVQAAASGEDGVLQASTWWPDLIVLDGQLPDMDALEAIRRLRPWCEAPILVLSEMSDEPRRVEALDAGADDFLQKPFGMPELVARLGALLRRSGGPAAPVTTLHFPGLEVDLVARSVQVDGDEVRLTPTEWRLLEALVTQPGKLVTHRWLLTRAYDSSYGDESRQALRAHVRSLRAKLRDDAYSPRFIRTESGIGYRWLPTGTLVDTAEVEPGATDDLADTDRRDTEDVIHELNNVLTAMRLTAFAIRTKGVEAGGDLASKSDDLVQRAAALATELQRSAAATVDG
ncbi:response regulator transcription factor [Nocardioides sp. GCM10027113]|uniref:response regulator transcription factor n=1 Tax=unclassified Nocardioides TaxID=2615069 RepID=UPI00361E6B39